MCTRKVQLALIHMLHLCIPKGDPKSAFFKVEKKVPIGENRVWGQTVYKDFGMLFLVSLFEKGCH